MLSLTSRGVQPLLHESSRLLAEARAGDVDAYGELCRVYEARVLRQALSLSRNTAVAEDLAQETLIEGWRCLRRYNGQCQFFTWLCSILLHRYHKLIRSEKRFVRSDGSEDGNTRSHTDYREPMDETPLPDRLILQREQSLLVHECMAALPPRHQQVVYLRFFADCSLPEIAGALGCSVGTVKSRLFHALEKLGQMRLIRNERLNS